MNAPRPSVYLIGTMDTKCDELTFVAERLRATGAAVKVVDVGTKESSIARCDVDRNCVLQAMGHTVADLGSDRGKAIGMMSDALTAYLYQQHLEGDVAGILGIGGSGGTALISKAMRSLSIGLPKLLVSTVASGNINPYVDCSDIAMMYSVVDIAGLNSVSKRVLSNAAHAMAGMVLNNVPDEAARNTVGLTMFGVTTPCVTEIRRRLEERGTECLVFHAVGTGGRTMEQLVESGMIQSVLDITTTEVADYIVGGVFACKEDRFQRIAAAGIPAVFSVGAVDMVNFGAIDTVPERFKSRRLYVHNAQVTLMRTTSEECAAIARFLADKLNSFRTPFTLLLPEGGVSALDKEGQPFYDPEADQILIKTLEDMIRTETGRRILRVPYHINAPEFAALAFAEHQLLIQSHSQSL